LSFDATYAALADCLPTEEDKPAPASVRAALETDDLGAVSALICSAIDCRQSVWAASG